MVAFEIVKKMYENVVNKKKSERKQVEEFSYDNKGAQGVMEELQKDIDRQKEVSEMLSGYEKQIAEEKVVEHGRELKVFEEVESTMRK